jgi:hypothetical protein
LGLGNKKLLKWDNCHGLGPEKDFEDRIHREPCWLDLQDLLTHEKIAGWDSACNGHKYQYEIAFVCTVEKR